MCNILNPLVTFLIPRRFITWCLYPAVILYACKPFFLGYRELPTPIVLNGVPSRDWPSFWYWLLYIDFCYNGFIILFNCIADESFFIMNIVILGKRFATAGEMLQLLNYSGPRDRKKDREVLVDSCKIHAEVLE